MYVQVERKYTKDHRHKLAHVSEGPLHVTKVEENTLTIGKTNRYVENISISRVVFGPKTETKKYVSKLVQPVKLSRGKEIEKVNMKDIVAGNDDVSKEDEEENEKKRGSDSEIKTKQDERNLYAQVLKRIVEMKTKTKMISWRNMSSTQSLTINQ